MFGLLGHFCDCSYRLSDSWVPFVTYCILKDVSNTKCLGVAMNTRLSWKKHFHEIYGKANQMRQFLQRNLVACKPETKLYTML